MAKKEIVTYPNPILKQKSKPITAFNSELKQLVADMAETMFAAPGSGLTAVQIGVLLQVVLMNLSENENENKYMALINPEILEAQGTQVDKEGCLSVPEYFTKVKRAQKVKVQALDLNGNEHKYEFEDWLARVIQHEVDHMHGILILDRISSLKRALYKKRRMKQLKKEKSG
ncbi:MAG: peptide deformylase [Thermodesulfobacteriota bacterium]|nr:peptide deformylase [Thermodesulfobacteriota bacterium]